METTIQEDLFAQEIAEKLNWEGKDICKIFLSALTDANYHNLRKILEPIINSQFED